LHIPAKDYPIVATRMLLENTSVENLGALSNLLGGITRNSESGIVTYTAQPGATPLGRKRRFILAIKENLPKTDFA
jgi:hypothetical protein